MMNGSAFFYSQYTKHEGYLFTYDQSQDKSFVQANKNQN